jgi:hypothetical protein
VFQNEAVAYRVCSSTTSTSRVKLPGYGYWVGLKAHGRHRQSVGAAKRVEQTFRCAVGLRSAGVPPARWAGNARQCFAAKKLSTTEGETSFGQPAGRRRYLFSAALGPAVQC